MSQLGGAVRSSSMISLQRSMHSSQMYTPGPAISFLTWRCDLPQKLQRSCSLESVGRAKGALLAGGRLSYRRRAPSLDGAGRRPSKFVGSFTAPPPSSLLVRKRDHPDPDRD